MIQHVWSLACEHAVIDDRTNGLHIQHIIEQVTIFGKPDPEAVIALEMEVVSFWVRDNTNTPSKGYFRLSFYTPSGTAKVIKEGGLDLLDNERLRTLISLKGARLSEAGRYNIVVDKKDELDAEWQNVANIPLFVSFETRSDN